MSLRDEERIEQLFQPMGDLSSYFDHRVRQLLIPKSRVDELREDADERAAQAAAVREAEKAAKEAKRSAEKQAKAAQARIIAETARECAAATRKRERRGRAVPVFTAEQIEVAQKTVDAQSDEAQKRFEAVLAEIRLADGYRRVPSLRSLERKLAPLRARFPNLVEAIDRIGIELVVASAMRPEAFRVTPILLVGEPGLGKTCFARSLAGVLKVEMDVLSAGGSQAGFQLTGSASHWSNAQIGMVLRLLARSRSATPVFVIDEIDKFGSDSRYSLVPAVLDLLEPVSARNFKDEALQMTFDASKMIVLLTANDLDLVSDPLLSRVEILRVPRPDAAQRLGIINAEIIALRKLMRRAIDLAPGMADALAERVDIDLRKTTRLLRDGFVRAMLTKDTAATLDLPPPPKTIVMGFGS